MTRHKPTLHASRNSADFDEAVASRTQEIALEKRNAFDQSFRDAVSKIGAATEEALARRAQELALDSQKTPSQSHPFQNATERAQEVKDEIELQKKALAGAQLQARQELALLSQNVLRQPYRHDFSKMRTLASRASFMDAQRDAQTYFEPRPSYPSSQPVPSPSSDPTPDFELVPATYDDIPELVQIHIEAYEFDQMTLLLRRISGKSVEEYKKLLIENIRRTWGQSAGTLWLWVARRKSDGEALGCAVWVIHDKAGKEKVMEEGGEDGEQTLEDVFRQMRWGVGGAVVGRETRSSDETPAPPRKDLNEYSHEKMLAMHERWVPAQTRYMYLGSLAVSSRHQSHGVGGALLHQGMSRADSEGLLIWLEATPAGHPVYEHYGWRTVESVSVRLQDFVGNPREQSGWGTYRMSGCLRLPLLVGEERLEASLLAPSERQELGASLLALSARQESTLQELKALRVQSSRHSSGLLPELVSPVVQPPREKEKEKELISQGAKEEEWAQKERAWEEKEREWAKKERHWAEKEWKWTEEKAKEKESMAVWTKWAREGQKREASRKFSERLDEKRIEEKRIEREKEEEGEKHKEMEPEREVHNSVGESKESKKETEMEKADRRWASETQEHRRVWEQERSTQLAEQSKRKESEQPRWLDEMLERMRQRSPERKENLRKEAEKALAMRRER